MTPATEKSRVSTSLAGVQIRGVMGRQVPWARWWCFGRTTRSFGIALCQGFGNGAGQVHNLGLHPRHIGANLGQFDLGLHPSVVFRAGIPSFCVGHGTDAPGALWRGRSMPRPRLSMVYTLNAPSAVQGHIAGIGPGFAPSSHQGGAVPIPTLATKAFCLYIAQRQHDVGVGVAGLACSAMSATMPKLPCACSRTREGAQCAAHGSVRWGVQLDLAGQLTVGPCLDGFDLIPQLWAVKNPSGGTARRQDCAVCHLAFVGVS